MLFFELLPEPNNEKHERSSGKEKRKEHGYGYGKLPEMESTNLPLIKS